MDVVVEVPTGTMVMAPVRAFRKVGRGQPTKCTPEITEKIAGVIEGAGAYIETAAVYAGISKSTFFNWMKWGNEGRAQLAALSDTDPVPEATVKLLPFVHFLDRIEEAVAKAELADLTIISRAGRAGAWQAAAWRLERRDPQKWGRMNRVELTGRDGGPVEQAHRLEIEVVQSRELTRDEFLKGVGSGVSGSRDDDGGV